MGIKTGSELSEEQSYEYFTYNVFNQLTQYRTKGKTATYTYLPNGYRNSKTVNGTRTNFVWDGDNIAVEADSNYNTTNVLFRGRNLIRDSKENNYVYDNHGDVTSILNNSGTTTKKYEYNAFGIVDDETNQNTYNPWQYCGEYRDEESGLIYLRNRYYDSDMGRFINEDPIRSGFNWYAYCDGNPVVFVDPFGLEYDSLRNLTDSVEEALDTEATISVYKDKVTVGFYKDGYNYRGTFNFDGTAIIDGTSKKIADNKDGHLYMERTDFYSAMGIKNESSIITQSNQGNTKMIVSFTTGIISGGLVTIFVKSPEAGVVVGAIVNEATSATLNYFVDDAGDYKKITIVGEVYNNKTGLYESIVTKDDYKLGPINNKTTYYRYSLTTEVDSYKYETSIFENNTY